MFIGIARADGGIEFLDPSGIGQKWGRTVLGQRYLFEASVKVFFAGFVDVRMAINFDIVASLCDIDTIEHVKETLPFEWNPEFVIDRVEEMFAVLLSGAAMAKSWTCRLKTTRFPAIFPE